MQNDGSDEFVILGIAGSLRRESYNRALLRAAARLAPRGVRVESFDRLREIPPYDQDAQLEQGDPEVVADLKARIAAADAVLLATPEYNYGVPGVLKNAVDWVSRPPSETPLRHKPIALVGASTGLMGTVRAQLAWRQVFVFPEAYVLPRPEVIVAQAAQKFDDRGELTDEATREHLAALIEALVGWARRVTSR